MGSWPVIIPPSPGVLCAYGDATTSLRNESARTYIRRFSDTSDLEVRKVLEELAADAQSQLDAEGVARADQTLTFQVDVRYHGQGFEVPVDVELSQFGDTSGGLDLVRRAFDDEHTRLFTFALDAEHELVNLRATVRGRPPTVSAPPIEQGNGDAAAAGTTRIWVDGSYADAALHDRSQLRAGDVIRGPAIVTEMDSTTLVLPGHVGTVDSVGSILIRPSDVAA
jgi:N-methylhydantoinase A